MAEARREDPKVQDGASSSPWSGRAQRLQRFLDRYPWLLPGLSFGGGWIGFLMVQRGESLARYIALVAMVGWGWLLIEPLVRRSLERRRTGMGNLAANFVTQSLQQELLFFCLPFMIGATQGDAGQLAFTGTAIVAALLSTIDPVYERYIASRAALRLLFHAYCSWLATLVVVPMTLRYPVERALPLSLWVLVAWIVLTLPLGWASLRTGRARAAWLACLVLLPGLIWYTRAHVPAAGLNVTDARITRTIEDRVPGAAVSTLTRAELQQGVIAYTAIRAPTGLWQSVVFRWRHGADSEDIVEEVLGGRDQGWRAYSRKQNFPLDPVGRWTVSLLTPQGQLLKRLTFEVTP